MLPLSKYTPVLDEDIQREYEHVKLNKDTGNKDTQDFSHGNENKNSPTPLGGELDHPSTPPEGK